MKDTFTVLSIVGALGLLGLSVSIGKKESAGIDVCQKNREQIADTWTTFVKNGSLAELDKIQFLYEKPIRCPMGGGYSLDTNKTSRVVKCNYLEKSRYFSHPDVYLW